MLRFAVAVVAVLLVVSLWFVIRTRSEAPAGTIAPEPPPALSPEKRAELERAPIEDREVVSDATSHASEPAVAPVRGREPRARDAGSPYVDIRGRALSSERVPLAGAHLQCFVAEIRKETTGMDRGVTMSLGSGTTTDAQGAFSVRIGLWSQFEKSRCEIVLVTRDPRSESMWRGQAVVEVRSQGTCDVGDVVLAPDPLILSGIVVNEQGTPVPAILIDVVDRERPQGFRDARLGDLLPVSTGKDGRFAIASSTPSQDLMLRIDHRDYRPVRVDHLRPPRLDLRIVLVDSGTASIHFSLLMDEECGQGLRGRAVRTVADPGLRRPFPSYADAVRGEQVIRPVEPGEYRLEVFDLSTGIVVDRIEGLRVEERRECDDARLHPIDLRGRLNCATAWLVDQQGRPLPNSELTIRSAAGESQFLSDKDGRIVLPMPPGSPEVDAVDSDGSTTPIVDGARIVARHGPRR